MRVRRTSDNTEQDIGFVGENLDVDSLKTFVGAYSGYVTIWYNQGIDGSDYDVIQTVPGNQPRIMRYGEVHYQEGRPTVDFNGAQSLITKDSPLVFLGTPISIFAVAYCEKTGNDANLSINWCRLVGNYSDMYWFFGTYYDKTLQSMFGSGNGGSWQFYGSVSGDNCTMFANSELVWHRVRMLATTIEDGTDNYLYCNGLFVSKTTNLEMASFTGKFSIGGSYTGGYSQAWVGNIQEVLIYRGQKLQIRTAIENNMNRYYNFPNYQESFPEPQEDPVLVTYSIYSVRQLNFDESFHGKCMMVRRSSDNAIDTIGFDENGDLDINALLEFCGSGDGFVTKWFDQTNRENDLIQTTPAVQPQIVSCGYLLKINNRPAIHTNGSTYLVASLDYAYIQPATHFLVAQMHKIKTDATHYIDGKTRQVIGHLSTKSIIYANGIVYGSKKYPRADKIYALFDGANSEFYDINNIVTGNASTQSLAQTKVLYTVTGAVSEFVVYGNEDKSADKDDILEDMADYYEINDPVTPLLNIWSVRQVNANYNGPCIRVRRSSDDKEMCIGFVDGELDIDHLEAFCGSGDGFVVVWYNQNLNGESFYNDTKSTQPQIVSSGSVCTENGKPALVADGSTVMSLERSYTIQAQTDTMFMVARTSSAVNDKHYIDGGRQLIGTAGGKLCIYAGASVIYFGTKATTQELLYALFNGASSAIGRNGATAVTGNAGTHSSVPVIFNNITGSIQELIIYPSNESANRSTIESEINGYYSIY